MIYALIWLCEVNFKLFEKMTELSTLQSSLIELNFDFHYVLLNLSAPVVASISFPIGCLISAKKNTQIMKWNNSIFFMFIFIHKYWFSILFVIHNFFLQQFEFRNPSEISILLYLRFLKDLSHSTKYLTYTVSFIFFNVVSVFCSGNCKANRS